MSPKRIFVKFLIIFIYSTPVLGQQDSSDIINKSIRFKGLEIIGKELSDTIGILYLGKKSSMEINHIIVWRVGKRRKQIEKIVFNFFYFAEYVRADVSLKRKVYAQFYFSGDRVIKMIDHGLTYEAAFILTLAREYYHRGKTRTDFIESK